MNWFTKWQPKDVIALVVVILAATLLLRGIDTAVGWTLVAIVCAYYGIDLTPLIKVGRSRKKEGG